MGTNSMWGQPPRLSIDASGNTVGLVGADGVLISFAGPAYLFANLPAASSNAGMTARVTDVGATAFGSVWQSDGVEWLPLNNNLVLARSNDQKGTLASNTTSGTYSQTGTTLTVTATAHGLTSARDGKVMRATFTTGSAVTGFYPFTYVSADSFTLEMDTSATTSGDVTLEGVGVSRELASVTIPGGVLGGNGTIEIGATYSVANNANNKGFNTTFAGALSLREGNVTTSDVVVHLAGFTNTSEATQKRLYTLYGSGTGGAAGPIGTSSVDTSVDTSLTFNVTANAVNDYVQLESYVIRLVR